MNSAVQLFVGGAVVLTLGCLARRSEADIYTLQGSRLEVSFVPEKSTILSGEPIDLVFSVTNLSDRTLQLMVGNERMPGAGNRSRFALSAVRQEDHTRILPPPPPPGFISSGMLVGPTDLRPHKPFVFSLFLPYELPLMRPGTYTISCGKLLEVLKPLPAGGWDIRARPETAYVELKTRLTVLPADRAGMGRVIEGLGRAAVVDYNKDVGATQASAWKAAGALGAIADERTIPWLVRLLECRDSTRKTTALNALARFNDPAAYAAITSGLATRGADLDDCTTARVAAEAARSIHLDAVRALVKCGYPAAAGLLKSLRHDPDETIRLQVVQFFGNRTGTEADAVLRELTHDENQWVRDEAERCLRRRASRTSV